MRLTLPARTASGAQAGARIKRDSIEKAQEGGDAQLVCSFGDECAFGFAAVRATEEQRSGRRNYERREQGKERDIKQYRRRRQGCGKQQASGDEGGIRIARDTEADAISGSGGHRGHDCSWQTGSSV